MTAKQDAHSMLIRAHEAWAAGDAELALEILDAAQVRLEGANQTRETMPVAFGLMDRVRAHLLALSLPGSVRP